MYTKQQRLIDSAISEIEEMAENVADIQSILQKMIDKPVKRLNNQYNHIDELADSINNQEIKKDLNKYKHRGGAQRDQVLSAYVQRTEYSLKGYQETLEILQRVKKGSLWNINWNMTNVYFLEKK